MLLLNSWMMILLDNSKIFLDHTTGLEKLLEIKTTTKTTGIPWMNIKSLDDLSQYLSNINNGFGYQLFNPNSHLK